jgi:outer membrane protein assembly factor BamD
MKKLLIIITLLILASCSKDKGIKSDDSFDVEKGFEKANTYLEKKDFAKARELFLQVKSRDVSGKYAPLAQLRYADSYFNEDDTESAIQQYRKFLDSNPDHKYAPYAQYQIAMAYFKQINGIERGSLAAKKALKEFEELKRLYPRNPYKSTVEMRIEKCKDLIAGYEFMVGEFYFKKKAYAGAIERLQYILKEFPDFRKEPQVLYMAAVSYKGVGNAEESRRCLDLLSSKYPDSPYLEEARRELK